MKILDVMASTIARSRAEISPNAPRILTMTVEPDKIREIIGPGGKTIRSIVASTGAKIDVEDDGRVFISAIESSAAENARRIISDLTREVKAGEFFKGRVTRLINFGAFVEVLPGKEGLLHVSEISTSHIPRIEDAFEIGDEVLVVVKEIDDMNRVNLSRRRAIEQSAAFAGDEILTAQLEIERERDTRYAALPKSEGSPRRDSRPDGRGDRDRGDRPRNNFRGDRGSRPDRRHDNGRDH